MHITRTQLLRAVAVGLSLASASLAHAGGLAAKRPASHAADYAAHKAMLNGHLAEHQMLNTLVTAPARADQRVTHLLSHAYTFDGQQTAMLAEKGGKRLEVDHAGLWITAGGTKRNAEPRDLVDMGIRNNADFTALVDKRVHQLAGIKVDPTQPHMGLQTLQQQVNEANQLVQATQSHPDARTMAHHATNVLMPAGEMDKPYIHIAGTQQDGLALHVQTQRIVGMEQGQESQVSFSSLKRHGVATRADLDLLVRKALLKAAHVKGDPASQTHYATAAGKLATETQETVQLQQMISQGGAIASPELAFLRQLRTQIGTDTAAQPGGPITLVENKLGTLRVAQTNPYWNHGVQYRTPSYTKEMLQIVDATSPAGRAPTLKELRAFGITNHADINTAVEDAVLRIAPEDVRL